ncbi:MAG: MoaD/ThiS family protein [Pseudomonadota bacterium]
MAKVLIPSGLRHLTQQQSMVAVDSTDLFAALKQLGQRFPDIKPYLFDENENYNPAMGIFVNDKMIPIPQQSQFKLTTTDHIALVPAIAGG